MTRARLMSCFALALLLIAPASLSMAGDRSVPSRTARPGQAAAWSHPLQPILDVAGITLHQPVRTDDADVWTEVFTSSAGDLDDDGSEDLIEYVYRMDWETGEESLSATAVRGSDGSTMWRRESATGFFQPILPAGDLDATPGDDVIGLTIAMSATGPVQRWDISYSAIRGSTGSALWSTTYTNRWGTLAARGYFDHNFVVPEGLVGDVDDDGHADLAVTKIVLLGADTSPLPPRSVERRTLIVHSGRNGSVLKELKVPNAEETEVLAVGPVAGGGGAEIGLASYGTVDGTSPTTTVAVYAGTGTASTGTTEEPLWERLYSGHDYPTVTVADVAGTEAMELLVSTPKDDDSTTITAIDGRDARLLWSAELAGSPAQDPVAVNDADEDGVRDLHVFTWFLEGESEGAGLALLSGADGDTLWSHETQHPEGEYAYAYAFGAGDITGDGVQDVFLEAFVYDEDFEDEWTWTELLDGAEGSALWSVQDIYYDPLGRNVDGRPGDDLTEIAFDEDYEPSAYRVVNGSDRAQVWSGGFVDLRGYGWVAAYDLRPGGSADIVESGSGGPTIAKSGQSGSVLWQRDPLAS